MTVTARRLAGLPADGRIATPFPERWGRSGREGAIVEFGSHDAAWLGNFKPGFRGLDAVLPHPDGRQVVVIARGDLWVVEPEDRRAELVLEAVHSRLDVHDPDGWIFSEQGTALVRFGPSGVIWHTRRLSWDGFDELTLTTAEVRGMAWSPVGEPWQQFGVDLVTGVAIGGSYWLDGDAGW